MIMATSQSKGTYKKVPSTDHDSNAQAFESLAKKLHRLESKAGTSYTPNTYLPASTMYMLREWYISGLAIYAETFANARHWRKFPSKMFATSGRVTARLAKFLMQYKVRAIGEIIHKRKFPRIR